MKGLVVCLWLCLGLQAADAPELLPNNIVNAADHTAGRVSPGEIVVLYPSNVGPAVLAGAQLGNDGRATTLLGETRVLFDGVAAPMTYTVRGEVGAVVPYEVANKNTTEVVVEYQGVRSRPVTVAVVDSVPALFTLDQTGVGQAAMLNETGCCNSARNPARRGSIASIYATGDGETSPPSISGRISAFDRLGDYPSPRQPVQVSVSGEAAQIVYAGAAPHAVAGLLQVNFRVPVDATLGDAVPIVLSIGNTRSRDGVTMAIRSTVQQVLLVAPRVTDGNRLRQMLAGAGYEVWEASNGAEAEQLGKQHPIDLVIVSLGLPEQERAAIRGLRTERPQVRIMATAGMLGSDALREADLLGAQAVITQGMASQQVLGRVRELLRPRPARYFADERPALPGMR